MTEGLLLHFYKKHWNSIGASRFHQEINFPRTTLNFISPYTDQPGSLLNTARE
jgi:hypothetical protein